jgi:hypothetical protein
MTPKERRARIQEAIDAEAGRPMRLFWLSFCDADKPAGQQFLGVAIVEARGLASALAQTWAVGCNPGGEAQTCEIPESARARVSGYMNRLMSKKDLRAAGLLPKV